MLEREPERDGLPVADQRWRVPWLEGLLPPPADATWPRLMSVPDPRAAGSLGMEFVAEAERREGRPLRWWQKLAATRMLEVDDRGELLWDTVLLSTPRQLGKSWLLRELMLWRLHQAGRFGEPQNVVHTGKDLRICMEVQLPARLWAKGLPEVYAVKEANGKEEIKLLETESRWLIHSTKSMYGWSTSLAAADEAWAVKPAVIEEGLEPTMVERAQPQLLLVSTAHRLATSLMLARRALALDELEAPDGTLLLEWSAAPAAELDDMAGWRQASAHWTPRRERTIRKTLERVRAGAYRDPTEPDPVASFRSQWLNQWPTEPVWSAGPQPLLPGGLWEELTEPGVCSLGPVWVAVEDEWGRGAAVAAVGKLPDGRLEVEAWSPPDWDTAIFEVQRLALHRPIGQLLVGASMIDRIPSGMAPPPQPVGATLTRVGLSVFRDLAAGGQIVHDQTTGELDDAISRTVVREAATGLMIVDGPRHVIKAAVWAVAAAHKPAPVPAVF
jgi:hypothetical protein